MADWKFVPHLCQVWDKGLFLLHRWSLSADLEIDVIGTRGSRTSIDSRWRSVEGSWMTAVAIVAIHSELNGIIAVWHRGHDGRLTSCFYPASVRGWSLRRHRPWPCLSLGMNSVVGNHCNYHWHLLFHVATYTSTDIHLLLHQFLNCCCITACVRSVLMLRCAADNSFAGIVGMNK